MASSAFDPVAYKETTRAQWQEAAEAWHRWGPTLEQWLGEATELMLDQAQIGPGAQVLDLAAGAGGQTIAAARRVGPSRTRRRDRHLARRSSPSPPMRPGRPASRTSRRRRWTAKRSTFDDGTLRRRHLPRRAHLLPRPAAGAARDSPRTSAGRASLRDRLLDAEHNQFFSIPVGIIRRIADLPAPAPGLPGPFSLGGPGVLDAAYANAGFEDVDVRALEAPVRFPTAAECVRFERESFGALHAMLAGVTPAERDQAWDEIETELRQFEGSDGFVGPCELLIGGARRAA